MNQEKILTYLGIGALAYLAIRAGESMVVNIEKKKNFKIAMEPVTKAIETSYGIKPIITLAQSALESNWGTSGLTDKANNLFGFTASDTYVKSGKPVINMPTKEFINGKWVTQNRYFRKYASWYDSAVDWAKIISGLARYKTAYENAKTGNVELFALNVTKAGYATDPRYTGKIIASAKDVGGITV